MLPSECPGPGIGCPGRRRPRRKHGDDLSRVTADAMPHSIAPDAIWMTYAELAAVVVPGDDAGEAETDTGNKPSAVGGRGRRVARDGRPLLMMLAGELSEARVQLEAATRAAAEARGAARGRTRATGRCSGALAPAI